MNYIRHLNAFFSYVKTDTRLTASHVSLYMALFQYWNFNRFQNPFSIYRENIMQLSKIGSKNTYHKCIKQLHEAKYIYYHPAANRFHLVRISVIPLHKQEQPPERYKQLDLFPSMQEAGGGSGTYNDTGTVPKLGQQSTDFDIGTVSKMRHIIKPNINKQRETPTHEIFKRNKKIQEAINELAGVPNSGLSPSGGGAGGGQPSLEEVQTFFTNRSYPEEEATKFYNHYKALGWKIQGKTPIQDWKPLVEKWMQNAKKWDMSLSGGGGRKAGGGSDPQKDLQYLYDSFLEGKKIFQYISPEHFHLLDLQLTDEALQQAWKERINQVSGTNQHSNDLLWQAYLTYDPDNDLVKKDKPNFIALSKRIRVIHHFQTLKNQSQ